MSKFFLITGFLLIFLFLVFFTMSYVPPFSSKLQKTASLNLPQTVLYFNPDVIYSPCLNTSITATIYLKSFQNLISGAQIELSYDPNIFHNVNLIPAQNNFFGNDYGVLINEVREEFGRATLALEKNPRRTPKNGDGAVAILSFQVLSNEASQTASISFLNKSTATNNSISGSLLKKTQHLNVICKR